MLRFQHKWPRRVLIAAWSFFALVGVFATAWFSLWTLLFRAASRGDLRTIELLPRNPFVVDARELEGETPLMYAAAAGQTEAVRVLISKGAALDAISHNSETPLARAVRMGHVETVKVLLESGAGPNIGDGAPLQYAAAFNHPEILRILLRHGADVNGRDSCGATALIHAISHNTPVEIVQILVDGGARVDVKNCDGNSAIHLARQKGRADIIEALSRAGTVK